MNVNDVSGISKRSLATDFNGEEWRQIPTVPGYSASNLGRVKRNKDSLLISVQNGRYQTATIKRKKYLVHRLVAQAWIPNPATLPQVNHIDGNKHNNQVDNLEWCDAFHNMQHCERLGLKRNQHRGERTPTAKLTETQARWIMLWRLEGFDLRTIGGVFGVAESVVSRICNGKRWAHLGGLDGFSKTVRR